MVGHRFEHGRKIFLLERSMDYQALVRPLSSRVLQNLCSIVFSRRRGRFEIGHRSSASLDLYYNVKGPLDSVYPRVNIYCNHLNMAMSILILLSFYRVALNHLATLLIGRCDSGLNSFNHLHLIVDLILVGNLDLSFGVEGVERSCS